MHTFMDTHRVSLEVRGLERQVLAPGGSSFFYSFLVITGFGNTGSPGTSTLKKLMANEPPYTNPQNCSPALTSVKLSPPSASKRKEQTP